MRTQEDFARIIVPRLMGRFGLSDDLVNAYGSDQLPAGFDLMDIAQIAFEAYEELEDANDCG